MWYIHGGKKKGEKKSPSLTIIFKHRKRKKQMLYLRFAPKSINTESKHQDIDLMGRCFACKFETRKIGVRHDIS